MDLRISDLKNQGFAINDEVTHLPSDFFPHFWYNREIEQLESSKKHKENEATEVLYNPSYIIQTLGQLGTSLNSPKAGLEELLHPVVFHRL